MRPWYPIRPLSPEHPHPWLGCTYSRMPEGNELPICFPRPTLSVRLGPELKCIVVPSLPPPFASLRLAGEPPSQRPGAP